jgi:hypothetical protein
MSSVTTKLMVPEEARGRGPIFKGELKSPEGCISDVLVQFDKVYPTSKKAKIYLYPTAEQANTLCYTHPPFTFQASCSPQDGIREHWTLPDLWISPIGSLSFGDNHYLTFCSGNVGDLHIKTTFDSEYQQTDARGHGCTAWFVINRCFLLQILATDDDGSVLTG